MAKRRGECPECGWDEDIPCATCGLCYDCCACDALFDADELGLNPEDDDKRAYGVSDNA